MTVVNCGIMLFELLLVYLLEKKVNGVSYGSCSGVLPARESYGFNTSCMNSSPYGCATGQTVMIVALRTFMIGCTRPSDAAL